MRQGVAEAIWHADHRRAFGALLVTQPMMAAVLADLAAESEAAPGTALRLAKAFQDDGDETEALFLRIAAPVSKSWVCKRGPQHAYEAMECLGGNGYIESFPLARRYREAPLLAIWEGSGNVIALGVLPTLAREPDAFGVLFDELSLARGAHAEFDRHLERVADGVRALRARLDPAQARLFTEQLALGLQASLLLRHAPDFVSDAFVRGRLGAHAAAQYGATIGTADVARIITRHDGGR